MNRETFKTQLSELFPGETLNLLWHQTENGGKITIKRELTRLELGNLFSLGMKGIKRSGEGVSITFDLTKAHINTIYQTETFK